MRLLLNSYSDALVKEQGPSKLGLSVLLLPTRPYLVSVYQTQVPKIYVGLWPGLCLPLVVDHQAALCMITRSGVVMHVFEGVA
jgi:hypothetical protein